MPNTPFEDAVDFVYRILKARTAGADPELPHADLVALDVVQLVKNEPGAPTYNWIGVRFGGFSEQEKGGLITVTVLVDVASQETMTGDYSYLARFTERVQKVYQLINTAAADAPWRFGLINCSEPQLMPRSETKWFYQATLTVPVTVGGGI